jgi:hypothetical protein
LARLLIRRATWLPNLILLERGSRAIVLERLKDCRWRPRAAQNGKAAGEEANQSRQPCHPNDAALLA